MPDTWKLDEELLKEYKKLSQKEIWIKLLKFAFIFSLILLISTYIFLNIMLHILGWTFHLSFVLFVESGVIYLIGGFFGTVRTSITLSKVSEKLLKTEPINPVSLKTAVNSVVTYTICGTLLFLYSALVYYTTLL
jgi:hypothetical protein